MLDSTPLNNFVFFGSSMQKRSSTKGFMTGVPIILFLRVFTVDIICVDNYNIFYMSFQFTHLVLQSISMFSLVSDNIQAKVLKTYNSLHAGLT